MTRLFLLLSVSILFLFSACQYEPEEINFVKVDSVGTKTMQIALDQAGDTIIVSEPTQVNFELTFLKDVKCMVKVFLGASLLYEKEEKKGSFYIPVENFKNGFYPLKIEVAAGTGTMSLADLLELEKALFEIRKVVQIETSAVQKTEITSVNITPDGLRISWSKYPYANLKEYVLRKLVYPANQGMGVHGEYHLNNISQTSYIDTTYVGGRAEFILYTTTESNQTAYSSTYTFEAKRPEIKSFRTIGPGRIEIKWTKSIFPAAFGSYHIPNDQFMLAEDHFASTNINDTICIINDFPFGRPIEKRLATLPRGEKSSSDIDEGYCTFKEVYLGDKIPEFETPLFLKNADRFYYYNNGYLYVMNHTDTKPYDSLAIALNTDYLNGRFAAQSPDGNYLYVSSGSQLVRLDPITLNRISSIQLNTILNEVNTFPCAIAVNNDHLLVVDVKFPANDYRLNLSKYVAFIDGKTSLVSDTLQIKSDIYSLQSRDDLRYLYVSSNDNILYEISTEGKKLKRYTIGQNMADIAVFTSTKVYLHDASFTRIIDLSSFNTISTTTHLQFSSKATIDPLTGNIGVQINELGYSILHPTEMNLLLKIPIDIGSSNDKTVNLINNRLVSGFGYRLSIVD